LPALLGGAPRDRGQELRLRIEGIDGRIAETEASITNLLGVLERRPSPAVERRLADLETSLAQLREDKAQAEDELRAQANGGDPVVDVMEAARTLNRVMASGDKAAIGDVNARLN